jgi:hypothetical protein
MNYVRCVNNRKYRYFSEEPRQADDMILGLEIGRIYKVALPEANDGPGEVRVIDDSGEDYLYPAAYFEPLTLNGTEPITAATTVHLPPSLKGILHAEALAAGKSVSALLRQWIDERLDLPQHSSA